MEKRLLIDLATHSLGDERPVVGVVRTSGDCPHVHDRPLESTGVARMDSIGGRVVGIAAHPQ